MEKEAHTSARERKGNQHAPLQTCGSASIAGKTNTGTLKTEKGPHWQKGEATDKGKEEARKLAKISGKQTERKQALRLTKANTTVGAAFPSASCGQPLL